MNFIESKFIKNKNSCDKLIEWLENNRDLSFDGCCGSSLKSGVNKEVKDTTDICVSFFDLKSKKIEEEFFKNIFEELYFFHEEYSKKYYSLKLSDRYHLLPNFNIQKYTNGQHFKQYHYENSSLFSRHRILTWMIYLNDVKKSGKTHFPFQNLKIKPKKGLMLIWPAEFTHLHCGELVCDNEIKYIMTGWFGIPKYVFHGKHENNESLKIKYYR